MLRGPKRIPLYYLPQSYSKLIFIGWCNCSPSFPCHKYDSAQGTSYFYI
uniref:Uncharacterized protein n=1 Tax=Rhizophora mucronata TaxID=61149 RepID=A0A2P2QQA8_RHIMU